MPLSRLPPWRERLALPVVLLVALAPAVSTGQVYKCVDPAGRTTYQQSSCEGTQRGGPVELAEPLVAKPGAPSSEKAEAVWNAAARDGRVVVGMPKPFVTQGLGAPAEIRAPRSGESGSEVWVYRKARQVTRIGFADNAVMWTRDDAPAAPRDVAPSGVTAAAQGAKGGVREARVREGLAIGKTCSAALQDAGPPDREETLSVGADAGIGTRYVYRFDGADANAFAAFVCLNGRVTSVERYVPGR